MRRNPYSNGRSLMRAHAMLSGLADGGPSDAPAIYVDAYGKPVAPPQYDAEAGGGSNQAVTDFWQANVNITQPVDQEAGGGANQAPQIMTQSTPAYQQYPGQNIQVIVPREQVEALPTVVDTVVPVAPFTPINNPVPVVPGTGGTAPTVSIVNPGTGAPVPSAPSWGSMGDYYPGGGAVDAGGGSQPAQAPATPWLAILALGALLLN